MKKYLILIITVIGFNGLLTAEKIKPGSPEAVLEKAIHAVMKDKPEILYFILTEKSRKEVNEMLVKRVQQELVRLSNFEKSFAELDEEGNSKEAKPKKKEKNTKEIKELNALLVYKDFDFYKKAEAYFCRHKTFCDNALDLLGIPLIKKEARKYELGITSVSKEKAVCTIQYTVAKPAMKCMDECGGGDMEIAEEVILLKEKNEWRIDLKEKIVKVREKGKNLEEIRKNAKEKSRKAFEELDKELEKKKDQE